MDEPCVCVCQFGRPITSRLGPSRWRPIVSTGRFRLARAEARPSPPAAPPRKAAVLAKTGPRAASKKGRPTGKLGAYCGARRGVGWRQLQRRLSPARRTTVAANPSDEIRRSCRPFSPGLSLFRREGSLGAGGWPPPAGCWLDEPGLGELWIRPRPGGPAWLAGYFGLARARPSQVRRRLGPPVRGRHVGRLVRHLFGGRNLAKARRPAAGPTRQRLPFVLLWAFG